MDVGQPVSGTVPVLKPKDAAAAGGGKRGGVDGALAAVGTMLRHVGTIDVSLEIGYQASST